MAITDTVSFADWKPRVIAFAILAAIFGTVFFAAMRGALQAWDQIIQIFAYGGLGSLAAFSVLLFFSCIDTPYRMGVKMQEFEDKYPKLLIVFRDNDDAFVRDSYFGVRVETTSSVATARNAKVFIAKITPLGIADKAARGEACARIEESAILTEPNIYERETNPDIHPGSNAFFPIIHSSPDQIFIFGHHKFVGRHFVPAGSYRVKLRATAENHWQAEQWFVIGLSDKNEKIFEIDKSREGTRD